MKFSAQVVIDRPRGVVWSFFENPATWNAWWGGELRMVSPGWKVGAQLIWSLGAPSKVCECTPSEQVGFLDASNTKTTFLFDDAGDHGTTLTIQEDYSSSRVSVNDPARRRAECHAVVSRLKQYVETRHAGDKQPPVRSKSSPDASPPTSSGRTAVPPRSSLIRQVLVAWGMGGGIGVGGLCLLVVLIGLFGPGNVFDRNFLITYGAIGIVALGIGLSTLRYYLRTQRGAAAAAAPNRAVRFSETRINKDWKSFAAELCTRSVAGEELAPQVCICCRTIEMAKLLAGRRPGATDALLSSVPEVLRFSDNTGAATFSVTNAAKIVGLCTMLLDGKDYGQPLSMKSVLVVGASESDQALVVRAFGAPQPMSFGKVITW
jgi:hypothetical protein